MRIDIVNCDCEDCSQHVEVITVRHVNNSAKDVCLSRRYCMHETIQRPIGESDSGSYPLPCQ